MQLSCIIMEHMKKAKKNLETLIDAVARRIPRMTKPLRGILSVLYESPGPISVHELSRELMRHKVTADKVTVYRKLELLRSIGAVQEVLLSDEKKYYELTKEHHHHLVCVSCSCVSDWVPDESVLRKEERRLEKAGFRVQYHSLELFGVCRGCAKSSRL
jgi:Fe2+ or Zn2+ uptake regulation protein